MVSGRLPAGLAVGVDEAELGGDDDLAAERGECLADELLVGQRTVDLGGVEERDAELDGAADDADHLVAELAFGDLASEAHAAEPEGGHLQTVRAECSLVHVVAPVVVPGCWFRWGGSSALRVAVLDGLAAVDDEGVADRERGFVGAQPQHGGGDLVDGAHAADWFLVDERRASGRRRRRRVVDHVGVDDAGADGVDADAGRGVVERGALGEADDAELRGAVGGTAGEALDAGAGGGVDDGATAAVRA